MSNANNIGYIRKISDNLTEYSDDNADPLENFTALIFESGNYAFVHATGDDELILRRRGLSVETSCIHGLDKFADRVRAEIKRIEAVAKAEDDNGLRGCLTRGLAQNWFDFVREEKKLADRVNKGELAEDDIPSELAFNRE